MINEENSLVLQDTKKDNIMIDENGIPWGIDLFTLKMGGVLKSHQNAKIPLYLQYFNYNK